MPSAPAFARLRMPVRGAAFYCRLRGAMYAGGSPRRHLSRSQARTAWWCELAWPGQAAHPAGSYKYNHLSWRFSVRASYDNINFVADIHITVRHHGLVSGRFSLCELNTRFYPREHVLQTRPKLFFGGSLLTNPPASAQRLHRRHRCSVSFPLCLATYESTQLAISCLSRLALPSPHCQLVSHALFNAPSTSRQPFSGCCQPAHVEATRHARRLTPRRRSRIQHPSAANEPSSPTSDSFLRSRSTQFSIRSLVIFSRFSASPRILERVSCCLRTPSHCVLACLSRCIIS